MDAEYLEVYYDVVAHLIQTEDIEGSKANLTRQEFGIGGMYELAKELTDQFQAKYSGTLWGFELDYFDELENFLP